MKLSPAQTRTLAKMKSGEWYTPLRLRESTATLRALERKGMVKAQFGRGRTTNALAILEAQFPRACAHYMKVEAAK